MALKRAVRQGQQQQLSAVSQSGGRRRSRRRRGLSQLRGWSLAGLHLLTLWRKSLQQIGGNFGGGVLSYFLFLRFLVLLNFFSFLLIAAFVLIPSFIYRTVGSGPANTTAPEECVLYDPSPVGLQLFYNFFLDLLAGTGFMEYSFLFYGFYNNTMVSEDSFSYNIPLAYISTSVCYFAFCLLCIIARMGTAARVAVATGGIAGGNYSMMVFTGWDYGCHGDQATRLKQKNLHYRLQVELEEESIRRRSDSLSSCQKLLRFSLRLFSFFFSLGLILAAFYAIFEATAFSQQNRGGAGFMGLLLDFLPSITITAANFLVPLVCDQIAVIERYSPSNTVILALLRAVFLRLVSLGVLLLSLWQQITCDGNTVSSECRLCGYNHREYPCWETRLGQEMYKLTVFDLLVNVASLVLLEFPRRLLVDHASNGVLQLIGRQEFSVPYAVLDGVYGQTVVWTGALYCPLLPAINTLKLMLMFYCKKISLFSNCRPALRTFRSSSSSFFFLWVLLIGWSLSSLVMIYSLSAMNPSLSCGPFRLLPSMWSIVPASFFGLSAVTQDFLFFVGSQAFSIPLSVSSCVLMCYFVSLAAVYGNSVSLLRKQLQSEGKDKQFLVKQINQLSRQLHIPNPRSAAQP